MKLLLSPHDDDSVLFAAFTCMREKPVVVICTDSYIQPNRGEVGCSAVERAAESSRAHEILGCRVYRCKIPDDEFSEERMIHALTNIQEMIDDVPDYSDDPTTVYAPAIQGGNAAHDMTGRAAQRVFNGKVKFYTTYTPTELYTTGTEEIIPTADELLQKKNALDQYESQLRINLAHFQAVLGKSEWYVAPKQCLHLGCGRDKRAGWVNLDRSIGADVVHDVTHAPLPFSDSTFDIVYSQDFLEHLPPEHNVSIINEIWRVLKSGGEMEHYIPNAGSRNDFGSPSHLSHWNLQCFEHFDVDSYRWEKDREYEGFLGGFKKVKTELVNFQVEEDGIQRAQSIHVIYAAVK